MSFKRSKVPEHWPERLKASHFELFEGTYKNTAETGVTPYHEAVSEPKSLVEFLTGEEHDSVQYVSIEHLEETLKFTAMNQGGAIKELAVEVKRKKGGLFIRKEKVSEYDALATSHSLESYYLYLNEEGQLMGSNGGLAYGRVLFFPAIGTGASWTRWDRVDSAP